jgi:RNA polymerase sigma factor (sigma-70 family)
MDLDGNATPPLLGAYFEQRGKLRRFFAARTGSPADAEDLLQELYIKVASTEVQAVNHYAYLFRLAANLMLDRARQARRSAARDTAYREATVETAGGEDIADSPSAEQALAAREQLITLTARLDDLPGKTREAFRLHKFEGLSHAETAVRMGVSRSAVEKYVSAALKHILGIGE